MLKASEPLIQSNIISKNKGIGLYIRDKCTGKIEMNRVILLKISNHYFFSLN